MTLEARARRAADDFRRAVAEMDHAAPERSSLDRFDRWRRRKQRNQRAGTVAVAALISLAAILTLTRAFPRAEKQRPALPPGHSGRIVFTEDFMQNDSDYIYSFVVDPDGSDLTQLGPANTAVCAENNHAWSPDGSKIVCTAWRPDLTFGPAIVDADSLNTTVLSNPKFPKSLACTAWSPDGTRLFCPSSSNWVYTVKPNGKGLLRLTATSAGSGPTGYTEDGSHAYFTVEDGAEHRTLYVVNTDGSGGLTALSPPHVSVHDNDYFDGVSADSSPDGSRIAFAADVTNTERALFVVNVDGSEPHQIETSGINPTSAQWSADGEWIAVMARQSTPDAPYRVYLIHPDGSGLRELTVTPSGCSSFAPTWSPDGKDLLFETQCYNGSMITSTTLETASSDGTGLSKVADLNGLTSYGWGGPATG